MREPVIGALSQLRKARQSITKRRRVQRASRDELAGKLSLHKGVSPLRAVWLDTGLQERHDCRVENCIVGAVGRGIVAPVGQLAGALSMFSRALAQNV